MAADLPTLETLLLERKRDVLFVGPNWPETRNVLGKAMVRDLTPVADLLAADNDIRAAVIAAPTECSVRPATSTASRRCSKPSPNAGEKDGIVNHNRRFGAIMSRFEALPRRS